MRITTMAFGKRAAALIAAAALAGGFAAVLTASAAQAVSLGTLAITPATGTESTGLTATLSAPCPGTSTGIVGYLTGPGITTENSVLQSNRSVAQTFQVSSIFKDVFQANAIAAPNGTYTVRMACIGADFFNEDGDFSTQVTFTPRAGTNNATYVTTLPATTTTLTTPTPADPVLQGASVTVGATVSSSGGTPAGSVQFKSGSVNLGAAVALNAGAASLTTTAIPAGAGLLTAVYIPGGNGFAASTSTGLSYVVAGPTTTNGSAKVGGTMGCTAVTGGTKTYSWLKNGVATGVTTSTAVVPAGWVNANITCALTSTKSAKSVTRTSTAKKVAVGAAPVAKVKPKVGGTLKVGKVLTCAKGTWAPTPSSYKYNWLRAGKLISGKTASMYKTVAADKGKLISCKVTALKAGYANGVASAPGKKIA